MRIVHLTNHVEVIGNGIVNAAVDLACRQAELGHDVVYASAGGGHVALLERSGVRHVELHQRTRPRGLVRSARALRRLSRAEHPDVVHAHMVTGALLARLATRGLAVPLVCSVPNEWQRHAVLMRVGDRVVAVSEANAGSLARRGVPPGKLRVVRNGPLGSPRVPRGAAPAPLRRPSVTTVAGLFERKGIDDLIAAFAQVPAEIGAHLYVVGDGPDRRRFEAAAAATGAHIHFSGFVADPYPYLRATDVFVLASRREPFGLVLAEAREAGCAIIATDVDGIPEVLDGGRAGVLVPPSRPDALARALVELLTDEGRRAALARAAGENLGWLGVARVADEMLAVYGELVGRTPRG